MFKLPMLLSIILLIVFCFIVAVFTFSYVVCNELAIKPLGDIKRKLLVNMSKRKLITNESDEEGSIEEDNENMKKFEHIIRKFRLKYSIVGLVIIILFILMLVYSAVELSAITVAALATIVLLYLLSRLIVLNEDMKQISYEPIQKLLKLDDKFMDIIKNDSKKEKEEVIEEDRDENEIEEDAIEKNLEETIIENQEEHQVDVTEENNEE